jgi:hypothetical protein
MQVLVALARADGAIVSRAELIRTCWNGTVVGEGFDQPHDLAAAANLRGHRPRGLPHRDHLQSRLPARPARSEPARAPARSRRLAWAALAVLLVAAVAGALVLWRPASAGPAYSVNVQPFRIAGAAQGFDDELMSALTRQDVPTAGGRTALILTGSAEERDGIIRVNARLADPDSDELVWSGTIERAPAEPNGSQGARPSSPRSRNARWPAPTTPPTPSRATSSRATRAPASSAPAARPRRASGPRAS